ncbi:hypothetical protein [Hymenobacter sp.]|jgi:hypothetical protein|uniref:hypothetical protein n=1 Tax=Hymenobacter sp. TaxID=1898978 RepID=UPI002ED774F8
MNASNAAKHSLSEHDERVHSILAQVGREYSGAASFLADYGISQELAQRVNEMLKTPLTFLYSQHQAACKGIADIMRRIVVSHVQNIAKDATVAGFWEVQREEGDSTMEYTIALSDYSLEKRALLRNFKTDYQNTEFADLAPLVFHFIPEKRAVNVINSNKIEL